MIADMVLDILRQPTPGADPSWHPWYPTLTSGELNLAFILYSRIIDWWSYKMCYNWRWKAWYISYISSRLPIVTTAWNRQIITILYLQCIKYNFRFIFAFFLCAAKIYVQMLLSKDEILIYLGDSPYATLVFTLLY